MSNEMPDVIYAAAKKGEGGSDHWARREYPGCHRYWRDDIVRELALMAHALASEYLSDYELFGRHIISDAEAKELNTLKAVANRFLGEAE